MAHRPKTLSGNLLLFLLALAVTPILVSVVIALWGPWFWASFAVVAATCVGLFLWRRSLDAARERAWTGSFSFADAVAGMRAREAAQAAARSR
jgi:hypothetical protein